MIYNKKKKMISEFYKKINDKLKNDFLWTPPYNVTLKELDDFCNDLYTCNNEKELQEKIRLWAIYKITSSYRRSYQMVYRYRELSIFTKNILDVIECSTVAYFELNFPCAYLSLLPVIETLMNNWEKEINIPSKYFKNKERKQVYEIANFISNNFKGNLNDDNEHEVWLGMLIEDFQYIMENILYISISKYKKEKNYNDIFNRNSALHYLENITLNDTEESKIGAIRLFLLIDIIAEIYLYYNEDCQKYKKLLGHFDLTYNENLRNLYYEFYESCLINTIYNGNINILNNVFLKKSLSDKDIEVKTEYFKLKKEKYPKIFEENNKKIKFLVIKKEIRKLFLEKNEYLYKLAKEKNIDDDKLNLLKKINCNNFKKIYKLLLKQSKDNK